MKDPECANLPNMIKESAEENKGGKGDNDGKVASANDIPLSVSFTGGSHSTGEKRPGLMTKLAQSKIARFKMTFPPKETVSHLIASLFPDDLIKHLTTSLSAPNTAGTAKTSFGQYTCER